MFNFYWQDIEASLKVAISACEEIKTSKKFSKILKIILIIGNVLNTGTKNAQSFGFEISYLPKVTYYI